MRYALFEGFAIFLQLIAKFLLNSMGWTPVHDIAKTVVKNTHIVALVSKVIKLSQKSVLFNSKSVWFDVKMG